MVVFFQDAENPDLKKYHVNQRRNMQQPVSVTTERPQNTQGMPGGMFSGYCLLALMIAIVEEKLELLSNLSYHIKACPG